MTAEEIFCMGIVLFSPEVMKSVVPGSDFLTEEFDKWDWLKDGDYLVILIENQGCCRAGIRRKDLTKADPPVYVAADRKGEGE